MTVGDGQKQRQVDVDREWRRGGGTEDGWLHLGGNGGRTDAVKGGDNATHKKVQYTYR